MRGQLPIGSSTEVGVLSAGTAFRSDRSRPASPKRRGCWMVTSAEAQSIWGRHAHLFKPRLTRLPTETFEIIRGRRQRVRRVVNQVALAVTFEVDGILQ